MDLKDQNFLDKGMIDKIAKNPKDESGIFTREEK